MLPRKQKTSIINCSFTLQCAGTLLLLDQLVNYSSIAFFQPAAIFACECSYIACTVTEVSVSLASFSHNRKRFTVIFAIAPFDLAEVRKEENKWSVRAVSHQKRLTVVLFSCFLLCYWHRGLIAAARTALLFGYNTYHDTYHTLQFRVFPPYEKRRELEDSKIHGTAVSIDPGFN